VSGAEELLSREGWLMSPIPAVAFARYGAPAAWNAAAARVAELHGDFFERAGALAARVDAAPVQETLSLDDACEETVIELTAVPRGDAGVVLVLGHDRTLDANLKNALVDSRQRFRDLLDISGVFGWECDAEGVVTFVSRRGALGYGEKELLGRLAADSLCRGLDRMAALPFTTPIPVENAEIGLRQADGTTATHQVSAIPLYDADGRWIGARGVCRDISADRARDRSLAQALQRERLVGKVLGMFRDEIDPGRMLATAAEAVSKGLGASGCQIWGATPSLAAESPEFEQLATYGEAGEQRAIQTVLARFDRHDVVSLDLESWRVLIAPCRCRDQDNGLLLLWRFEDELVWEPEDRELAVLFATQAAIAIEQLHNHRRLVAIAQTDPLTGLLNRRGFLEEVRRRLQRMQRSPRAAALMFVDLDNFKDVNDVHGHSAGDDALVFVRDLLRNNTRPTDLVARIGGDEFVIWLDGAGRQAAERRAKVLQVASASLRRFSGTAANPLGMSIGVVTYDPKGRESIEDLLARADSVMYGVKRDGKGGYALAPGGGAR